MPWEFLSTLVSVLGKGGIIFVVIFLVVVLVPIGIWVFSHIRRDRQGKVYWFSQKYEDSKRNKRLDEILEAIKKHDSDISDIKTDVEAVKTELRENTLETKRTSFLFNVHQTPEKAEVIERQFEEYKALGGDGYIDDVYHEWKDLYGTGVVRKRISHKSKS